MFKSRSLELVNRALSNMEGKNLLINGDFSVWQRGNGPATETGFLADRWDFTYSDVASRSIVRVQVSGKDNGSRGDSIRVQADYSGSGGASTLHLYQAIEDVRIASGQKVTVSFRMKSNTIAGVVRQSLRQDFGSGGSSTNWLTGSTFRISTEWETYSAVVDVASTQEKTVGIDSYLDFRFSLVNEAQGDIPDSGTAVDYEISDMQIEIGDSATAFEIVDQTTQLLKCQRYYQRSALDSLTSREFGSISSALNTSQCDVAAISYAVDMRAHPTVTFYNTEGGTAGMWSYNDGGVWTSATSMLVSTNSTKSMKIRMGGTFVTQDSYVCSGNFTLEAEL